MHSRSFAISCRVLILEDHDCIHIAKGAFEVFNAHQTSPSKSVQRVHQILNLEVNHIMKGGYDHFMQKEIHEQPETLARTMQGRLAFDTAAKVRQSASPYCLVPLTLSLPFASCLLLCLLSLPPACCLLAVAFCVTLHQLPFAMMLTHVLCAG